jgi:hypothetical protein
MSPAKAKVLISPECPAAHHSGWLATLAALLAWQAWLTLGLFGCEQPWLHLNDDQPVISGRHALHLYHGYLGARALLEHGSPSCYDPAFHAGYPKTPIFDGGSRPAEITLALAGGHYSPRAYKIGLALLCLAAPALLFAAARSAGLRRGPSVLAAVLGMLVWWGTPCRDALDRGAVDLLLATLLMLVQVGLLLRYHRAPGAGTLVGLTVAMTAGWFAHPPLMAMCLPLFLTYYITVGARHQFNWHAALWSSGLAAVGVNGFWLVDWVGYWWIRVPPGEAAGPSPSEISGIWGSAFWGGPVDRALALGLCAAAAGGVLCFQLTGKRVVARLLGLGWAGLFLLAIVASKWELLARVGGNHLLVPALLFAAISAAHAASEGLAWFRFRGRLRWAGATAMIAAVVVGVVAREPLTGWLPRLARPEPLQVGLGPEREAVLATLMRETTPQARILWEDRHSGETAHWTPLLPLLTGRSYVGGLDPDATIEHTTGGLVDGFLAGRCVTEWTDADIQEYCDRYNVGWVICSSTRSRERFVQWDGAGACIPLPPEEAGAARRVLIPLRRKPNFALRGSAHWACADPQRIVLDDVTPHRTATHHGRGTVVLSLHYQAGMRVTPSRVRLERAEEPQDSIPFVRLVVTDPVTRVTITWDKH